MNVAAATVARAPQQFSETERDTVVLQALQWAEVEGGPKSPLVVDAWYFVNRFTFLKVIKLKFEIVLAMKIIFKGQGVDEVVQAEGVRQLSSLCGHLLQIHPACPASGIQVLILAAMFLSMVKTVWVNF